MQHMRDNPDIIVDIERVLMQDTLAQVSSWRRSSAAAGEHLDEVEAEEEEEEEKMDSTVSS